MGLLTAIMAETQNGFIKRICFPSRLITSRPSLYSDQQSSHQQSSLNFKNKIYDPVRHKDLQMFMLQNVFLQQTKPRFQIIIINIYTCRTLTDDANDYYKQHGKNLFDTTEAEKVFL